MRTSRSWTWMVLHSLPLLLIPAFVNPLGSVVGMSVAAAVAHATVIAVLAVGQAFLMRGTGRFPMRWMWQSACGIAIAIAIGLVVMSTVDIAGYDVPATFAGMTAAGITLGLIQAPLRPHGRWGWVAASAAGWLIGAILYRYRLSSILELRFIEAPLFATAYNAGHNELLWTAMGFLGYGLATAIAARRYQSDRGANHADPTRPVD